MPAPEYIPLGSASARPSTTSIAEIGPSWPTSSRPSLARFNGSATPLRANSQSWAQQRADVDVAEAAWAPAVDDAHHLLGRDAVGRHRGDERARAGADVDVELVDRAVDGQQVERAQGADLVDAAGEAAADRARARSSSARGACLARAVRRCLPASRSTTFPMSADS
jgi:hypothetical protein